MAKRRVGIVGFGALGQHLARSITRDPAINECFEIAFVWNRSKEVLAQHNDLVPSEYHLEDLSNFAQYQPDIICEVAHQSITQKMGPSFVRHCDYFAGSSTAFADLPTELAMREAAAEVNGHGVYIPRGALPSLEEVLNMTQSGRLKGASIMMEKHPNSINFQGPVDTPLTEITSRTVLYNGPLRPLCGYAPNNVNTMAVLALSSELGFDAVNATLVADPSLKHHITSLQLEGPSTDIGGEEVKYSLDVVRKSPAGAGDVTSTATFNSFLNAMLKSSGRGDGFHFV